MMSSGVSFGFCKTKSKQSSLIQAPAAESFTTEEVMEEEGQREFLSDASQVAEIKKKVQAALVIPCRGNRVQLKSKSQRGGEEERADAKKSDEKGEEDLNSVPVKEISKSLRGGGRRGMKKTKRRREESSSRCLWSVKRLTRRSRARSPCWRTTRLSQCRASGWACSGGDGTETRGGDRLL